MNGIKKRYETQKLIIDGEIRDVEIYRVPELLKQVPGGRLPGVCFLRNDDGIRTWPAILLVG